ncbi:MAG: tetratricopeptide repeat protein [Candidatus Tectomicrobia bacterium]|nr:tetratricopeptide repeat protein [Candidatus Tectomicrobia bacterium]
MPWLSLTLVLGASLALWLPFLSTPLFPDQGLFNYQASRWRRGFLPYRDTPTNLGIGLLAMVALAQVLSRGGLRRYNACVALTSTATTLFVFLIGRELGGPQLAVAAALAYALYAVAPYLEGYTGNQETFMNLPLTAAVYLLLRAGSGGPAMLAALAGAAGALAALVKPVAAFTILPLHVWAVTVLSGEALLWLLGGDMLMLGGSLAGLVARGAWEGVRRQFLRVNLIGQFRHQYGTKRRPGMPQALPSRWRLCLRPLLLALAPLLLLGLAGALQLLAAGSRTTGALLALWLIGTFAGASFKWRFNHYYFVQVVPPLAVLSGIAVEAIRSGLSSGAGTGLTTASTAILGLGAALVAALVLSGRHYLPQPARRRAERLYGTEDPHVTEGFSAAALAEQVERSSAPRERVLCAGYSCAIPYLAGRDASFHTMAPIFPFAATTSYVEERQRELAAQPPRFIVHASPRFDLSAFEAQTKLAYRLVAGQPGVRLLRAVSLDASAAAAWREGEALLTRDRPADAAAAFQKALRHDPACGEARRGSAVAALRLGRTDEALETARGALAGMADCTLAGELACVVGVGLLAEGKIDAALPNLERAARLLPAMPEPALQLAALYLQLDRPREALERAEQLAVQISAHDSDAANAARNQIELLRQRALHALGEAGRVSSPGSSHPSST